MSEDLRSKIQNYHHFHKTSGFGNRTIFHIYVKHNCHYYVQRKNKF